jgi:hypothetical protein
VGKKVLRFPPPKRPDKVRSETRIGPFLTVSDPNIPDGVIRFEQRGRVVGEFHWPTLTEVDRGD